MSGYPAKMKQGRIEVGYSMQFPGKLNISEASQGCTSTKTEASVAKMGLQSLLQPLAG